MRDIAFCKKYELGSKEVDKMTVLEQAQFKELQEKAQAIEKIKQMYNIDVNDDVAEAILLGKYAVDAVRKVAVKKLF